MKPLHKSSLFAAAVVFLTVFSVGYGMFLIGSPSLQRARGFDQQRLNDLQQIAGTISAYWDAAGALPSDLASIEKTPYYYISSLKDPKTEEPYEYRVKSGTTFELCAVFETDLSQYPLKEPQISRIQESWGHGKGRACFEREVLKKQHIGPIPLRGDAP